MYSVRPIMPRSSRLRRQHRRGRGSRGSSFIIVAVLLLVNYFAFFRSAPEEQEILASQSGLITSSLSSDDSAPRLASETDDFGEAVGHRIKGEIKRGQTITAAMKKIGIDSYASQPVISAMSNIFDFRKSQVGDRFSAHMDDSGQIAKFTYEQSPLDIYEVKRLDDGSYEAIKKKVPTRVDMAEVGCTVKSTLYESISRCGEGRQLANMLIDLFSWDIDFFQDVHPKDQFKLVVEKISVDGVFLRYGRILAAEYKGKLVHEHFISYTDPEGQTAYYKPNGHAVEKEFIKSPLKYSSMSANSSADIRSRVKNASPVIYTAQAGTEVWAVASGTVIAAGNRGGSLGNTVTIRHENGFVSSYAHLGSIPSGIQPGTLLKQKTVIGKVGQSEASQSPQLLFSLRKNGNYVDPLKKNFAEGAPVAPEYMSRFESEVKHLMKDLEEIEVLGLGNQRM